MGSVTIFRHYLSSVTICAVSQITHCRGMPLQLFRVTAVSPTRMGLLERGVGAEHIHIDNAEPRP